MCCLVLNYFGSGGGIALSYFTAKHSLHFLYLCTSTIDSTVFVQRSEEKSYEIVL